jgi:ribose transport system ATP-binding protein
MSKEVFLSTRKLTKKYGPITVLDKVSLDFREGEIHAVVGENGAGKSTLCKMISGAVTPESGEIVIRGKAFSGLTPIKAKAEGISMVYQEFNLVPEMPIYENLFIGKEIKKGAFVDTKAMLKKSSEIFDEMGVDIDVTSKIKDISVAYCQLVEIAKALLEESRLLILDEPTAPLTNVEVEILFKVLAKLKKSGISMIYISHRLEEVFRLCDKITVLRDGRFIKTLDVSKTDIEELIHLMIGRELSQEFPERIAGDGQEADTVLEVKGLTNKKISGVSFKLKKGEILGIAGLVGAGRTEVVRAVFGADKLHKGEILVRGKKVKIKSPAAAVKQGIGLIPEDRKREGLMTILTIKLNLSIIVIKELCKSLLISKKKEKNMLDSSVRLLSIRFASLDKPASSLSGGNQQKIVLGKWLATKSNILIFDEPTRGIDVGTKKEIYDFLFKLKSEGKSMILISSEMPEILALCDRIIVMHEGRMNGELGYRDFSQEKVLTLASGLK